MQHLLYCNPPPLYFAINIAQYMVSARPPCFAIQHTILVYTISCKGQAFTRYSVTSSYLCTNQSSFHSSGPSALPTLLQYDCTTTRQYTTPPLTSCWYAIHHTVLVITISCTGQLPGLHISAVTGSWTWMFRKTLGKVLHTYIRSP